MSDEKLVTLNDLFEHKIKDLYSSQEQLETAYQEMAGRVSHQELRTLFEKHRQHTKVNRESIETISQELGFDPKGVKCTGTEGIIAEGKEIMEAQADPDVVDAGLLATAQVIAHYEIANYGAARNYAQRLGYEQAIGFLNKAIEEEKETDAKLTRLAESTVNANAQ